MISLLSDSDTNTSRYSTEKYRAFRILEKFVTRTQATVINQNHIQWLVRTKQTESINDRKFPPKYEHFDLNVPLMSFIHMI